MAISMSQSMELSQALRLTQEQKAQLEMHGLTLRMELVQKLLGEKYEPQGKCPKCERILTPIEILRGFNQDPSDFTTRCSGCGYRFQPKLVCFGESTRIEVPFYCEVQVSTLLRGKELFSPEEFARRYQAVYRSAIFHHGTLKTAFGKAGIEYRFKEIKSWENKVQSFLGRLPDAIISECAGVSTASVTAFRKRLGISRCTREKMLQEADEN